MKIVIVHNTYQQPGGEDVAVAAESNLLERHGHTVVRYSRSNNEIAMMSGPRRLLTVKDMIHSTKSRSEMLDLLRGQRPDLVHVHNTFMMVSPSVFEACREAGVPVVHTLHNYRLLCAGWSLSREGKVCEECLESGLWRGVWHGCYRDSRLMTAAVALMLQVHRMRGTWNHDVGGYVALTNFARAKFIEGGLPPSRIGVKPNFLESDPGERSAPGPGGFALFAGRLSAEKGAEVLLQAWQKLKARIPLVVLGDGPLRESLETEAATRNLANVTFAGWRSRDEILAAMKSASLLITPSLWYEGFPMTVVEAFACGTPVVCSRLGGLREIVEDGSTGLHFNPGDAEDLAGKLDWLWTQPSRLAAMGRAAREEYQRNYTAERNYELITEIYERTMAARN
jgi:glycosyltransferase involved in cell wall biosynthesis